MKRFVLFVLLVVSCQLLVVGSSFGQVTSDTVNGWYVNRTVGTVNTAYSRIVADTATEGTKSQAFFVSLNQGASVEWSKSFGSHRKPRLFRVDVRLNQMNPQTCAWDFRLKIYLHHGDTVQALAAAGWCGNNLGRWEEYEALTNLAPVPYFFDKLTFKLFINDPGASGSFEILCDNLRLFYMNNPPQVDSIVQIDRFGDDLFYSIFSLEPAALNFDSVLVGNKKVDSAFVKNTGTDTLRIRSVTSDASEFTVGPVPNVIAPRDSARVLVTFRPTAVGARSGNIIFTHNASTSPDTLRVAGIGTSLPPPMPVLAFPTNGAVNQPTTLTLRWYPAARAESYHLQVSTDSLFNTTVVNDSTLADTLRRIGPLSNLTKYYWRVRAKNIGGASAYSEIWHFTTIIASPPMPVLAFPTNGAVNQPTTLTLRWYPAARAESYHLQVSTDSLFNTTVVNDSTLADTLRRIGPLSNLTKYYWRVRAGNVTGWSAYSQIWSFTTIVTLPSQVLLVSPADSAIVGADSVVFLWRLATPQVDRYWFELALDSLFNFHLVDSTLTDTITIRRQFINNQTYWWRVRAHNAAGWGQFSNPRRLRMVITSVAENTSTPKKYQLFQNYPNPFNPKTKIRFEVRGLGFVSLKVYDMFGREVAVLVNETLPAGDHEVEWDAEGVASGVYFYKLVAGNFIDMKKAIVIK